MWSMAIKQKILRAHAIGLFQHALFVFNENYEDVFVSASEAGFAYTVSAAADVQK